MWEELKKRLLDGQRELEQSLVQFPASDMMQYNRIVGRHEGLSQALTFLEQISEDDEKKY